MPIKPLSTLSVFALASLLTPMEAPAVVAITGITTAPASNTTTTFTTSLALTGADLGNGASYTQADFIEVATVESELSPSTYDIFWGSGDAQPDNTSLDNVLLGTTLTDGVLNPRSTGAGYIDFLFASPVGGDVLVFNPDGGGANAESWNVQALSSPGTLVGNPVSLITGDLGDSGVTVSHSRNSGGNFTQNIRGFAIEPAEFGVGSPIAGIRITTSNGDPSVVVGTIPEPSTTALALAATTLIFRRRSRPNACPGRTL